ncbi:hypothetical protein BV22DRAFT_1051998 [Leucogyrophana mollusca]|uniref:Uncharacterized protein n=1 Tax=Leucogyrophana mollusca TaxID=85980 RepID=A0ACB8AXE7_9AGAM|nr:hypothetical protein BV22DRAFT_1051998 [Leucogyrophana mollusca]
MHDYLEFGVPLKRQGGVCIWGHRDRQVFAEGDTFVIRQEPVAGVRAAQQPVSRVGLNVVNLVEGYPAPCKVLGNVFLCQVVDVSFELHRFERWGNGPCEHGQVFAVQPRYQGQQAEAVLEYGMPPLIGLTNLRNSGVSPELNRCPELGR